jgi:choline kinase
MERLTQNMNNLTVLILAAGMGRRMGPFSRMINKALVPYGDVPLVSRIFENFDSDTKFVIACGHLGNQIKEYISLVHPARDVSFIDIPRYDEQGTGPATTIRYCAKQIDGPFMWISSDTLFKFRYQNKLDHNWIAVHPVDSSVSGDYSWVERDGDELIRLRNKEKSSTAVDAFIGLMYVHDRSYIENLDTFESKEVYEGFVFDGRATKVYTVNEWKDFGTYEKWKALNDEFVDVSFPKPDEIFYADNYKIVKFSQDQKLTEDKFRRAKLNPAAMPANVNRAGKFLSYDREPGSTLYKALEHIDMNDFLDWVKSTLWISCGENNSNPNIVYDFYKTKTDKRVELFRSKYRLWEEPNCINDTPVKTIDYYLSKINFDKIADQSLIAFLHGDMQPENIIYNYVDKKFVAIDWRPNFGGDTVTGDIHYDIAKLVGGLYLDYEAVKSHNIEFDDVSHTCIQLYAVPDAGKHIETIKQWCQRTGLNWETILLLVPLIYLNMAPLHEAPFDKYLIALSQYFFEQVL